MTAAEIPDQAGAGATGDHESRTADELLAARDRGEPVHLRELLDAYRRDTQDAHRRSIRRHLADMAHRLRTRLAQDDTDRLGPVDLPDEVRAAVETLGGWADQVIADQPGGDR